MQTFFKLTFTIKAINWPTLLKETERAIDRFLEFKSSKDYHDLGSASGEGGPYFWWDIKLEKPIEARIAELRREADELEEKLRNGGAELRPENR